MSTDAIALESPVENASAPARWLRAWPLLTVLSGLCVLGWAATAALERGGPRVQRLHLSGDLEHVAAQQLRERIEPFVGAGLFAVDLHAVRAALEAEPWIASARVSRSWPGSLQLRIEEHRVAARGGRAAALSEKGEVFAPPSPDALADDLPQLDGPGSRVGEVLSAYRALAQRLEATPLAPQALRMDARGEWYMRSRSGVELRLGREAPARQAERIAGEVLPALAADLPRVDYIDLRYSNGFAVGWRAAVAGAGAAHG